MEFSSSSPLLSRSGLAVGACVDDFGAAFGEGVFGVASGVGSKGCCIGFSLLHSGIDDDVDGCLQFLGGGVLGSLSCRRSAGAGAGGGAGGGRLSEEAAGTASSSGMSSSSMSILLFLLLGLELSVTVFLA